jgi:hypothetical protein
MLKDCGIITINESTKEKSTNEIFTLYQQICTTVYNDLKTHEGDNVKEALKKLKFDKNMNIEDKYEKPENIPEKVAKKFDEVNKKNKELRANIASMSKEIQSFETLYMFAYKNNNFVTFPYLHNASKDVLDIELHRFVSDCFLRKHTEIFEWILDEVVAKIPTKKFTPKRRDTKNDVELDSDKEDEEDERDIYNETTGLDTDITHYLANFKPKEYFTNVYFEWMENKSVAISCCALNVLLTMAEEYFKNSRVTKEFTANFTKDMLSQVIVHNTHETSILIGTFVNLLNNCTLEIPFHLKKEPIHNLVSKLFRSLVFARKFRHIIKLQRIVEESLLSYFKFLEKDFEEKLK